MKTIAILGVGSVVLALLGYQLRFWHRIYPRVQVASVKVGDTTPQQAQKVLAQKLSLPTLHLVWGTSQWQVPTASIGLAYDPAASAQTAYTLGRSHTPWQNFKTQLRLWRTEITVPPHFVVDENKIVENLSSLEAQINIPVKEPDIQLVDGKIIVSAGDNGQAVDERILLEKIKQALAAVDASPIEIPVRKIEPKLSDTQVQKLQIEAEKLVGKKITLKLNGQTWEIPGSQIVAWLDPTNTQTQLSWKRADIETWISELAATIDRPAANARFRYSGSGKVEEFSPAQEGLATSQTALVEAILRAMIRLTGSDTELSLDIPVTTTPPGVQTSEVNNLGIKELIARGESDYSGSIPNRIFNLHKAAQSMNGVLVAPGEEFSFDKYVGDISAAGGYKQAYVIKQGRTVLGDGGGVCQVSTTMFRAALNAGLPITARTPHAYRVHYYENGSQLGLDATIFTPSVDFKFKNDTPAYILIQTAFDEAHNKLFFDLYGTRDNRQVNLLNYTDW